MTIAIQKRHKTHTSRTFMEYESNFETYRYDKFYRFQYIIPFRKLVKEITNNNDQSAGFIFLSAALRKPQIRELEMVERMQMFTFYIRPENSRPQIMERLKGCPIILFAGYTNMGGIRFGIPVILDTLNFSRMNPEEKQKAFRGFYNGTLMNLRSEYELNGIKSTPDILECFSPLQVSGFYDNTNSYDILHL